MDKTNSHGSEVLTLYWFFIIVIVASAIVYMAYSFYGAPFDVRNLEGRALSSQIAGCLTNKGYINEQIFSPDFQNNFLANCNINFTTEDFSDWKINSQYYAGINVYKFSPSSQYQGETGSTVSNIYGDELVNLTLGNINLKIAWELLKPRAGILSFIGKRNVNKIVIHATAGADAFGAIQTLSENKLSIHYMIDRDGTVYSINNNPTSYVDSFEPENNIAQQAGCYDPRTKTQWEKCSSGCLDANGLISANCQALSNPPQSSSCCIEENSKSIGIELVNLQSLCTGSGSSYCKNAVTVGGKQWETYSDAQINSLVILVSDIAARYNIPLSREDIIGHYQSSSYKFDPGPQFPWEKFMQDLNERGAVASSQTLLVQGQQQKAFYAIDKNGTQYIVQVLSLVGKTQKNV